MTKQNSRKILLVRIKIALVLKLNEDKFSRG